MRWALTLALTALVASSAWGQAGIRLPRALVASGEAHAIRVSPESQTLVGPGGAPLFLRGMWRGERIAGHAATLWEASPEIRDTWLGHLRSRGFNCLGLDHWPASSEWEAVSESFERHVLWLLIDASAPRPAFRRMAEGPREPIDWARFRDRVPPLVTVEAITREAFARALIQPMSGLMLASPEIAEGEADRLVMAVALWTSMVPWHRLSGPVESAAPLGLPGRMRRDAERRHTLLLLPPAPGARALRLEGLPAEPLLADLFPLETMRRRRQAVRGPAATLPLGPRDRAGHLLVLLTPLPRDWAPPDSTLAEP